MIKNVYHIFNIIAWMAVLAFIFYLYLPFTISMLIVGNYGFKIMAVGILGITAWITVLGIQQLKGYATLAVKKVRK